MKRKGTSGKDKKESEKRRDGERTKEKRTEKNQGMNEKVVPTVIAKSRRRLIFNNFVLFVLIFIISFMIIILLLYLLLSSVSGARKNSFMTHLHSNCATAQLIDTSIPTHLDPNFIWFDLLWVC